MDGETGDLDPRQRRGMGVERPDAVPIDAELVLAAAGRDLVVGVGGDVRVDPDGDRRALAAIGGDPGQQVQLGLGFDVELQDPGSRAKAISAAVLPTPEKTQRAAGTPAARARRSSPSETTSAPAPRSPSVRTTARFELAFSA